MTQGIDSGSSFPLGATAAAGGVNFSLYSKNASAIDLLFFDTVDAGQSARVISLDRQRHRTYHYWHAYVPQVGPGQIYGYRAHGPLMHLAGFTRHPNSGVAAEKRGTYAGLVEKIPYLQDLGITAVELLPVFQFDPQDCPLGLTNYWGYCPVSFFAPHLAYSSRPDPLEAINEFRDMVKALHRAGIEAVPTKTTTCCQSPTIATDACRPSGEELK